MNTTPSPAIEAVELPPLPPTDKNYWQPVANGTGWIPGFSSNTGPADGWEVTKYYTADQMRAYARSARSDALELAERLKQEAQIHAGEARTANATIAEIYQLCTGATGEPGNWSGAEPVRALLAAKQEEVERMREALTLAVKQNEHDMLMTGEELRICRAALRPTQGEAG